MAKKLPRGHPTYTGTDEKWRATVMITENPSAYLKPR